MLIQGVGQGALPQLPASVEYFESGLADVVSISQDRLKASHLFPVSMEWPVETAAPAAVAGARAEQPGIAEVRVAQPGVADVLAEQPDERWKSRADKQVQCGRCDRCRVMIAIAGVSLCGNCFYETDASFKCDLCGFHEKDLGGLDHRSGRKLCRPCFDYSDNADRRDNMEQIEREIALQKDHLAWQKNRNQAMPTALG